MLRGLVMEYMLPGAIKYKPTNKRGQIRICCPYCSDYGLVKDKGFHCYVDYKLQVFYCFRCNEKGRIAKLRKRMRCDFGSVEYVEPIISKKSNKVCKYMDLFGGSMLQLMALKYWYKRGFTDEEARHYNIQLDPEFGGLVIPVYDENGYYVFDVKRSILGSSMKYYIDSGVNKSNYIYNLDKAKHYQVLYLVEGVFDAMAIGDNGCALFGKFLSDKSLNKLLRTKVKKVNILLDRDAKLDSYILFDRLLPYFEVKNMEISKTPYKDISEFREKEGVVKMRQWLAENGL